MAMAFTPYIKEDYMKVNGAAIYKAELVKRPGRTVPPTKASTIRVRKMG